MTDQLKIKVNIADRVYPLTIKRHEEESIRKAAKDIEAVVKKYEENYAVKDKQDLLAMCALQLAARLEKLKMDTQEEKALMTNKLSQLVSHMKEAIEQ